MYRKLTLLVAALALPAAAFAQTIFLPPGSLPAPVPTPVPTTPAAGATVKGVLPAMSTFELTWIEYGIFSTPLAPLPTHFVVCLKLASAAACTFGPADFKPAANIPNGKYYNSGWQHVGYQYTYTLSAGSVPDSLVDADSTWSVGACRNAVLANCVFSAPRALRISAVDLNVQQIRNNSTSARAIFLARSKNGGTNAISSTPPFKTSIVAWDALKSATNRCRVDIDAMDVRDDPNVIVFMNDGSTAWMTTLPLVNNVRTAPVLVVGMHRWNGGFNVHSNEEPNPFDLPAGRIADAATVGFDLPSTDRPKPFVVRALTDSRGLVKEFDENNNWGASCEYVP